MQRPTLTTRACILWSGDVGRRASMPASAKFGTTESAFSTSTVLVNTGLLPAAFTICTFASKTPPYRFRHAWNAVGEKKSRKNYNDKKKDTAKKGTRLYANKSVRESTMNNLWMFVPPKTGCLIWNFIFAFQNKKTHSCLQWDTHTYGKSSKKCLLNKNLPFMYCSYRVNS